MWDVSELGLLNNFWEPVHCVQHLATYIMKIKFSWARSHRLYSSRNLGARWKYCWCTSLITVSHTIYAKCISGYVFSKSILISIRSGICGAHIIVKSYVLEYATWCLSSAWVTPFGACRLLPLNNFHFCDCRLTWKIFRVYISHVPKLGQGCPHPVFLYQHLLTESVLTVFTVLYLFTPPL